MKELRFATIGSGFWSQFQLAAWTEIPGVTCVAVCDVDRSKAQALASRFGIANVYDDPDVLFRTERIDFADVITSPDTHVEVLERALSHGIPAICQKPLAPTLEEAREIAARFQQANLPLFVHENWRWQRPIREFKRIIDEGRIGRLFRARITYSNSFPVFDNQPFLKDLEQFILADIGTHLLDVARFLFGEPTILFCRTSRVRPDIRGEDVATVILGVGDRTTITCEMSYASRVEHDRFPETFLFAEGEQGAAELGPDYWLRITTSDGTHSRRCPPPRYSWADPAYDLVHASIVDCHRDLAAALREGVEAETTAADNLQTLKIVFGAYESARTGRALRL